MVFVYVTYETVTAVCWQMSQQAATLTAGPVSPLCLQMCQLLTNLVPRTSNILLVFISNANLHEDTISRS